MKRYSKKNHSDPNILVSKETIPSNQKQSVIGVVFNGSKERVLLIKRRDVPVWVLPGGGVDLNETPEAAVVREVLEETGLLVSIKRLVAVYTPINSLANLTHVYECVEKEGGLTVGEETKDLAFFSVDQLPKSLFFVHKNWLDDARKQSSDVIFSKLTEINYLNLASYFLRHPWHILRFAMSRMGMPINSK